MSTIIHKYGGTSIGSIEKIKSVAKKIILEKEKGNDVVVVVSAMGKTTNKLVDLAKEISSNPDKREFDVLLSTGEQISISLTNSDNVFLLVISPHTISTLEISFNAHVKLDSLTRHLILNPFSLKNSVSLLPSPPVAPVIPTYNFFTAFIFFTIQIINIDYF